MVLSIVAWFARSGNRRNEAASSFLVGGDGWTLDYGRS